MHAVRLFLVHFSRPEALKILIGDTADTRQRVGKLLTSFADANPHLLQSRLSLAERHNMGLFVHPDLLSKPDQLPEIVPVFNGEVGHIHGESSLHLNFAPSDARVIIERGWGERHRSAKTQPWWLGGIKHMWGVGDTFLMVYAPRDEKELHIVETLIGASAAWMTGERDVEWP
jgi:hypothetical protein